MTTTWADIKHQAIERFNGELPNAETEQAIIDAFELEPVAVIHALDAVTISFRAGKARSGWAVWRSRVASVFARKDVQVDVDELPGQIAKAEAWIRNCGGYVDHEDELVAALFGPAQLTAPLGYLEQLEAETRDAPGRSHYDGLLRAAIVETGAHGSQEIPGSSGFLSRFDSPALRERMLGLWRELRPRFEAAEREAELLQLRNGENYRALRKQPACVVEDPDAFYDTIMLPEEATI